MPSGDVLDISLTKNLLLVLVLIELRCIVEFDDHLKDNYILVVFWLEVCEGVCTCSSGSIESPSGNSISRTHFLNWKNIFHRIINSFLQYMHLTVEIRV